MPSGKLCCRWLKRNLENEPTTSTARGEMGGGEGGRGGGGCKTFWRYLFANPDRCIVSNASYAIFWCESDENKFLTQPSTALWITVSL